MSNPFTILADEREAETIADILSRAGIAWRVCPGLPALLPLLDESAGVIVAEEQLAGAELSGMLAWLNRQKPWSDLAFLVLATREVESEATERTVLDRLGNAVLLERPLRPNTLASAARMALRAQRRQYALRDLTDTLETRVASRTALLAESEARFRTMFEAFPDLVFTVRQDAQGRFCFESFNPSAERRTGYQVDEVRGRTLEEVLPADAAARAREQCVRCLARQDTLTYTDDVAFPAGQGTFETTLAPMPVFGGRDPRLLGLSRDVTERNRLEERLRSAQKLEAVGQLTGGVAHDFNNLLQVVLSGLTLMERAVDPSRRAHVLDSVRRAAQRGGELTKRLLTIARKQSLNPEPIDLGNWLRAGAADMLSRMLRGDIALRFEVQERLPAVEADANELELALLNLAVNARDAMPAGGTLALSASEVELDPITDPDELAGRYVRLSVSDTGSGMSAEVQARVFEPFFTTKEMGKGTGLGLAQVYGFARQSGGGVRLRSTPGEGTTVSLLLPMAREAPAPAPSEREPAPSQAAPGAAILVCEDDEEVAALVVDMLAQLGHRPTRVSTATAALGALTDDRRVDLLFSDVMMPGGMDGLALAREVARRRPGLPVLLTTGYTGVPSTQPLGVPVLRKPYSLDELSLALESSLATGAASLQAKASGVPREHV